jgi:hypothetical protein
MGIASTVLACLVVVETQFLGPFTGHDAKLHPANQSPHPIEYYGTDLGWSYEHAGVLHFLFGDTWATEAYAPIEASTGSRFDDGFGTVLRSEYPDAAAIAARRLPAIRLAQNPGSREMSAMDPGHVMDLGKTPLAGFSNGEREFGIFHLTKPQGCRIDADCGEALACETGLGFAGTRSDREEGLTLACAEGDASCNADTMFDAAGKPLAGSGFCIDRTSTIWADTKAGKVSAAALQLRVGLRSLSDPRKYTDGKRWLTNKFVNVTARTEGAGAQQRVLLWGRPGFIGVGAKQRTLGVYFAYADMPQASSFAWRLHYFAGTTAAGAPRFSAHEKDAVPLDLDSAVPGVQPVETHDVVNQVSVAWFAHLEKWVMFYGGGMTKRPTAALPRCGVLQLFTGRECEDVVTGNGAVRMRTSDQPWGPWSPPQDVIVGGDPSVAGSGQYGPGGALHHPACVAEGCATHSRMFAYHAEEYGFLYGVNIVEQWSYPAGPGVDVIWNASTWDPYRVVLMRTHVKP